MILNYLTNKEINEASNRDLSTTLEDFIICSTIYTEDLSSKVRNTDWYKKIEHRMNYWLDQANLDIHCSFHPHIFFHDNKYKRNVLITDYSSVILHNLIFGFDIDASEVDEYFPFGRIYKSSYEYVDSETICLAADRFDLHIDLSECKDDIETCLKNANANKGWENFDQWSDKGEALIQPIIINAFFEQFDSAAFYKKATEIIDSIFLNYIDN